MDQTQTWSQRELWTRKLLYPGHTFPTAAAPVMVAIGLAYRDGVVAPLPAFLALLAGWLIQFAGVVTDNYENLVRDPDDREHSELVEAVKSGLITISGLRATAIVCFGLAAVIGLYLAIIAGPPVLVIGLLSMAASWAYSAGPWPVGRHGLADPLFFLFFGVVSVLGTYYVQAAVVRGASDLAQALPFNAVAVSLPIGALITNILIIDDIRDRDFDVVKGKRTIAVRFGKAWSRAELVALTCLAYLAPFWFWLKRGLGIWALLPLLSLPAAVWIAREVWRRDTFSALLPMTPRAGALVLAYALLLAAGLALAAA